MRDFEGKLPIIEEAVCLQGFLLRGWRCWFAAAASWRDWAVDVTATATFAGGWSRSAYPFIAWRVIRIQVAQADFDMFCET